MKWHWNRNTVFSLILAAAGWWVIDHMIPPHVSGPLKVTVSKNNAPILDVHQPRAVAYGKTLWLDTLELESGSRLRHPKLGEFGYVENFFLDVETVLDVRKGGLYRFTVGSDDGFALYVDGRLVCEYRGDRPLRYDTCSVALEPGHHRFKLSYFQGGGNSGLRVTYVAPEGERARPVGEDSEALRFLPPQDAT
ncbi:MAG: hypothetical protein KatS3mg121_0223 [Gammaproteobacteria bacterium]|nr:MAG: hypothetical protein KatS3mg121_0223 [Gammaproteobacteria bacterium]